MKSTWNEFKAFLIKQNAIALAIAVVIGGALDRVVKSIVDGLIMPIVGVLLPGTDWEKFTAGFGSLQFGIGLVIAAIINFLIIGFVAWRMAKLFIKPEPAAAAPATVKCRYCRMDIDSEATRCAHCTSELRVAA
jgi:large conductance mechanosensitive channel